jgi:hypothetical protein
MADKFGYGCRVGAFVDVDGMDIFNADEGSFGCITHPCYIYFKDVSTLPSPSAALAMLTFEA